MIRFFCYFTCTLLMMLTSTATPLLGEETIQLENFESHDQSLLSSENPVHVELLYEDEWIQPGRPFWVAIRLVAPEHWHTYWKNPGDVGMPLSIEWHLPENFQVSPLLWPFPQRLSSNHLVGFGYEGEAVFLAEIIPPASYDANNKVEIGADIRWIACSESSCVPGSADVKVSIPTNQTPPPTKKDWIEQFAKARAKLPKAHQNLAIYRKNGAIELSFQMSPHDSRSLAQAYFCPEEQGKIDHKETTFYTQKESQPQKFALTLKELATEEAKIDHLKGVLVLAMGNIENPMIEAYNIDHPVREYLEDSQIIALATKPAVTQIVGKALDNVSLLHSSPTFDGGIGWAIILAFVGGMILNLMPCVLPVISLKILSFVKMAGQSRSHTLKHGFAFSFGVLVSFWVLAGALLALQAYGRSVGWGFQLQEPIFVAILAAIIFVLSLGLLGVLEIGAGMTSWAGQTQTSISGKRKGLAASFVSGVLATAVATPCTGPFLGSAIGFAVTLSPLGAMIVFSALGLGMAFPYLLFSGFPSLMKFLPKPGKWMITFKEIMGFLMLATVLWLIWVFGAQTNTLSITIFLGGLFLLAIACWIYGKWGAPFNRKRTRYISFFFSSCAVVSALYLIWGSTAPWVVNYQDHKEQNSEQKVVWEDFSPSRIAELQKQGIPVFVDFTAKWCLICQSNHLVLSSSDVDKKMNELGVVRMKADWTRNDPVITEELRKHGRNGVPLYLLYNGDVAERPSILPQMLTPDVVLKALNEIE